MNPVEALTAAAGQWSGTNTLQDPNTGKPEESPSTVTVTPVLGGRFVRLDYTWGYQGKPQEGSLLVGFDPKSGEVSGHWIDTWHMGRTVLACIGTAGRRDDRRPGLLPRASRPRLGLADRDPPGADALRITHTNIDADGTEDLAVEGVYSRA